MTSTPEILSDDEIADRIVRLKQIRYDHPILKEIRDGISRVRGEVRAAREDVAARQASSPNIIIKSKPLPVIVVIGASGTGKSHIITSYNEEVLARESPSEGVRRVIDLELSSDSNKRQFQSDVLAEYGDPDPEKGTDSVLRRRVAKIAQARKTEIALVDEVQHFIESDTDKRRKSVSDAFKKTLNAGVFGLGLFGTEKARGIITSNEEFHQRVIRVFDLQGANTNDVQERLLYREFLSTFRSEMERRGLIGDASILEDAYTVANLCLAARGQFGTTYRILEATLRVALEMGAQSLLPQHFWIAIERAGLFFGCKTNPFTNSPSPKLTR